MELCNQSKMTPFVYKQLMFSLLDHLMPIKLTNGNIFHTIINAIFTVFKYTRKCHIQCGQRGLKKSQILHPILTYSEQAKRSSNVAQRCPDMQCDDVVMILSVQNPNQSNVNNRLVLFLVSRHFLVAIFDILQLF